MHEINLQWNPKGEEYLWSPQIQTTKRTKADVLVYDYNLKRHALDAFIRELGAALPYCTVRYAF